MTFLFGYPFLRRTGNPAAEPAPSIYKIPVCPMGSGEAATSTLAPYHGQALLIVNVASRCGFTPQYEALEALHKKYSGRGLSVLGFPSNDFLHQEPGSESEIMEFCRVRFGVSFPLFAKVHVRGPEQAPLFAWLTRRDGPCPGRVLWNFEKFLVGRDGRLVARFRSLTRPDSRRVTDAIERELG